MDAGEDRRRTIADLRALIASVEDVPVGGSPAVAAPDVGDASDLTVGDKVDASDLMHSRSRPAPTTGAGEGGRRGEDQGVGEGERDHRDNGAGEITDLDHARQIALRRLTVRARSSWELRQDLVRNRVVDDVADQIVARFLEVGLLDDADFAREWVVQRRGSKSLSRARLSRELAQKGIPPQIIDQALEEAGDSETEVALEWARRRARSMAGKDRQTLIRRLSAQVERRGFSPAVVRHVVLQVVDEMATSTDCEAMDGIGSIVDDE
ncbi:MAG: recombination regulator RecX [Propionibacteriaceae bacterium]|nr:recombination regulator RecX [Propionibacteriaceae bacterium]